MTIKHGTAGADTLVGTSGADQLFGEGGNDVLKGLLGPDTLDGGGGRDTADYGASAAGVTARLDTGVGTNADAAGDVYVSIENLVGSAFVDFLHGDGAANRLSGGSGNDNMFGNGGNDTLLGAGGIDQIEGGPGADLLNGGGGAGDGLNYLNSTLGVNVNLSTGQASGGDAAGDTISGFERLSGSPLGDVLSGTDGANQLGGGGGDDRLVGFGGDDALTGNPGADTLIGGPGADHFLYLSTGESPAGVLARDQIVDFDPLDVIDLGPVDARAATAGDDAFEFLGLNGFIDAPGQIEYVFENATTVVRVNTGGDLAPEMEIQIAGNIDLNAGDFFL